MFNFFSNRFHRHAKIKKILETLDQSAEDSQLPMLDNGYIYLAASRLSLYGSAEHWAIVFEIFGFSPRAGHPDLSVTTISSKLHNRNQPSDYVSQEAYQAYITNNPSTEMRNFWPIADGAWTDEDEPELVVSKGTLQLRGRTVIVPSEAEYKASGVSLSEDRPAVFELCRYLANKYREDVLANETERRVSVDPSMEQIMLLDEWHHPDLAAGQKPSQIETFRQLAAVLERQDPSLFSAPDATNNHWKNWPDGGML